MAGLVAIALGSQNAMVRTLGVPDLTTTVLTLTLTGLITDARKGLDSTSLRRILAVTMMFGGGVLGAILVINVAPAAGLTAAVAVLLAVVIATGTLGLGDRPWQRPLS